MRDQYYFYYGCIWWCSIKRWDWTFLVEIKSINLLKGDFENRGVRTWMEFPISQEMWCDWYSSMTKIFVEWPHANYLLGILKRFFRTPKEIKTNTFYSLFNLIIQFESNSDSSLFRFHPPSVTPETLFRDGITLI